MVARVYPYWRLGYVLGFIKVDCPTFENFETRVKNTKPVLVIVATPDNTHHEFIIQGLEMSCDVLSEKPLTTD